MFNPNKGNEALKAVSAVMEKFKVLSDSFEAFQKSMHDLQSAFPHLGASKTKNPDEQNIRTPGIGDR